MPSFGDTFYTLGRWQPFAHHHFAVVDYFADEYDADDVYIGVLRTPQDGRSVYNPFTDEEVEEMIESAYDTDYDVPYEVEPFIFHDNPLYHRREVADTVSDDATFFTRERSWLWTARLLDAVETVGPFEAHDIGYVQRERDNEELRPVAEHHGVEIAGSATEIRSHLAAGDDAWRRYVADSVEELIDAEYGEAVEILRDADSGATGSSESASLPAAGKYQFVARLRERGRHAIGAVTRG